MRLKVAVNLTRMPIKNLLHNGKAQTWASCFSNFFIAIIGRVICLISRLQSLGPGSSISTSVRRFVPQCTITGCFDCIFKALSIVTARPPLKDKERPIKERVVAEIEKKQVFLHPHSHHTHLWAKTVDQAIFFVGVLNSCEETREWSEINGSISAKPFILSVAAASHQPSPFQLLKRVKEF